MKNVKNINQYIFNELGLKILFIVYKRDLISKLYLGT